ncbi:MAG: 30S ribosomal protein S9 [Candidatus Doudnabacteria bacterium]
MAHGKSFYAVGRRKTAVAQALLSAGNGTITINQLPFEGYFQTADLQLIVTQPLRSLGLEKQFNVKSKIHGGGIHAQAESLRHAISRTLIAHNPESRRTLKKLGFLKRDPRVKERKKPGLKRARRAPQFSKR